MLGKGTYTYRVDGQTIGFKFGMIASVETEKLSGCAISDVFKKINGSGSETSISILHYLYGGHIAYAQKEKAQPLEFEAFCEMMEQVDWLELFNLSVEVPKNLPTPEKKSPGISESKTS